MSENLFGERTSRHTTVKDYLLVFSEAEFNRLFKFTFVRNPWDRLVSAYLFLKHGGVNESDQRWAQEHLFHFNTFEQFAKGWLSRRAVNKSLHFRPQFQFLCGPYSPRPLVDFIGYFENLPDDFAAIAAHLGLRATLSRMNTTAHKRADYKSYYTDETRRIVADVYREDIEIFGYDFDNASLNQTLQRRGSLPPPK